VGNCLGEDDEEEVSNPHQNHKWVDETSPEDHDTVYFQNQETLHDAHCPHQRKDFVLLPFTHLVQNLTNGAHNHETQEVSGENLDAFFRGNLKNIGIQIYELS